MFRNLFPSLVLLTLAIGGSYLFVQSQNNEPQLLADLESLVRVTDVQASDSDTPKVVEMALGEEDAPVTIIEYASFTCPHCARFHTEVFGQMKADYINTGKVRFIVRDVYFDRFGLWAAMVARCESDRFFGVSDLIYRKQRDWTDGGSNREVVENLMGLGRAAGLSDEAMNACLQDNATAQALVTAYQENAERDGINSTPSFIINGRKYPNMSYADFKATIDALLAEL